MSVDFLNTYIPQSVELDKEDILDVRYTIQDYLTTSFPDVANQPGTVLGDLIVTPQAYLMTSVNKGVDNLTSDICLQNVADGVIFNCDFVKQYLNNFGIKDILGKPSTGVVRLVFSEDKEYILDRSTQFKLDSNIFSLYLPNDGDYHCYASQESMPDGINGDNLKDTGSGEWFCDVPVISNTSHDGIEGGEEAQINVIIPELKQAYSLDDFSSGNYEISLQDIAKLTQTTSYSASLNTRAGTVMYVNKFCPFITNVFAVRSGDRELLRSYRNGYGISFGCMDVYLRSQSYQFTEVQQVKVVQDDSGEWLQGTWDYVGQPYHLESITHPSINLKDIEDREIISTSDPQLGLGALAAYTKHEKLTIRLKNTKDSEGNSLFDLEIDDEGKLYTYVTVTYQTDPMFKYAQQRIENIDFAPINTSIMVRGFLPVIIKEFKVVYVRKPGVIPDLDTALDKIKIYLGNLGAPNQYSKAEIAKIMSEAGVSYIKDVKIDAYVQWSIGDKIQNYNGDIENTLVTVINSDDELRVQYPNLDKDLVATDMYACTPRILRYFVVENAIKFNEVRDV